MSAHAGPIEAAQREIWNVITATEMFGFTKAADMSRQLERLLRDTDDFDAANIVCMQQLTGNILRELRRGPPSATDTTRTTLPSLKQRTQGNTNDKGQLSHCPRCAYLLND